MKIEKNGRIYTVKENGASWTVSTEVGRVDISYNVPKDDCSTFEALKDFVAVSDLF